MFISNATTHRRVHYHALFPLHCQCHVLFYFSFIHKMKIVNARNSFGIKALVGTSSMDTHMNM